MLRLGFIGKVRLRQQNQWSTTWYLWNNHIYEIVMGKL